MSNSPTYPQALIVIAFLAAFVALAIIDTGLAVILGVFLLVFGGDIIRHLLGIESPWTTMPEQETPWTLDPEPSSSESTTEADEKIDALAELRSRYANGEINEWEFEQQLELLLQTETIEDAEEYIERQQTEISKER